MEAEKTFDAKVKAALKDLKAPLSPNTWEAFEQRLEAEGMEPGSAFDAMFASRLGNLEKPGNPADWDTMLQMIEADETAELIENEAAIDNVAYDKLADLSAPFRAAHWELMAKRLEEEFSLRHKLYKYKVAEIGLMLLLLLTIARYLPYAADLYQQKQEEQEQQDFKVATSPAVQMEQPTAEAAQPQALLQGTKEEGGSVSTPKTAVSKHQTSKNSPLADLGEKQVLANSIDEHGRTVAKFEKPVNEIHSRPLVEIASQSLAHPFAERLEGNNLQEAAPDVATSVMGKADFLDLLDAQLVDTKTSKDFPILKAIPLEKQKQVRFSLFASSDLNYVFTPTTNLDVFDTLVRVDNDTAFALGYGGGILASFKMNRLELQTGGVYSFRRYAPNTPKFTIETVGYYISEDFRGIQQDMLQVPLNMQYHFKNSGNWRFYGLAGASGYFITNVVYEIAFKREPTFALLAPPSGNETRTLRDEKEFPKGLFDGGSLSDNFYLTANLGLGVERFISPRWSLFFQPNYHHYLMSEGVGTNKDKFYTLSFYLGTKVSLK